MRLGVEPFRKLCYNSLARLLVRLQPFGLGGFFLRWHAAFSPGASAYFQFLYVMGLYVMGLLPAPLGALILKTLVPTFSSAGFARRFDLFDT